MVSYLWLLEREIEPQSQGSSPGAKEPNRRVAGPAFGLGHGLLRPSEPGAHLALRDAGTLSCLAQQIPGWILFPGRKTLPASQSPQRPGTDPVDGGGTRGGHQGLQLRSRGRGDSGGMPVPWA